MDVADVMCATQRPLSLAALTEKATQAAWKSKPSWYLVSQQDNAIPPDAERFMAQRMGAVTEEIDGSHTAFIAQPVRVAGFISKALAGLTRPRLHCRFHPGGFRHAHFPASRCSARTPPHSSTNFRPAAYPTSTATALRGRVNSDVIIGPDGKPRCAWACTGNTAAIRYHDEVWGTRTYDESAMFEALTLGVSRSA